jgi:hypothetical protein
MNYTIQGRPVCVPVEVREASSWSAQFLVPAGRAQALIDYSGLSVAQPLPGRALVALAVVRYDDTDLDRYNEVAVSVVVRPHDATPAGTLELMVELARGRVGVFIHRLPVNQTFTLEAGVGIWGYPKFLADIAIHEDARVVVCTLDIEGQRVLRLALRTGGRLRLPTQSPPTYSWRDGILRRTPWETSGSGVSGRLGGASLSLGAHPLADELRSLLLPRRALMTGAVAHMRASFGEPEVVRSVASEASVD